MAIVSMARAIKDKDKLFVGDAPMCITAPGKMGMMVGAGETLTKLIQVIALRDQFGNPLATLDEKVVQIRPFAIEIVQESNIFADCDFDLGNMRKPGEDLDQITRRDMFCNGVDSIVDGLISLMELAKVDTELERQKMEQVAGQFGAKVAMDQNNTRNFAQTNAQRRF